MPEPGNTRLESSSQAHSTPDWMQCARDRSEHSRPRGEIIDGVEKILTSCEDKTVEQLQCPTVTALHGATNPSAKINNPANARDSVHPQTSSNGEGRLTRARSIGTTSEVEPAEILVERETLSDGSEEHTVHEELDMGIGVQHLKKLDVGQDDGKSGDTLQVQQADSSGGEIMFETGIDTVHVEAISSAKNAPVTQAASDFEYEPIEASEAEDLGYPKLDFKPLAMRTWFLTVTMAFFLACVAVITAVLVRARSHKGIIRVDTFWLHLAYRYVPVALGSITTIWWRTVATTYGRLHPYLMMSTQKPVTTEVKGRAAAIQRALHAHYPLGIFQPGFIGLVTLLLTGRWLIATCILIDVVNAVYLMPLKASFVQLTASGSGWDAVVSPKIGYALMAMNALLSLVTLALSATLKNQDTGLKWEPVSIADQLELIQGSNIRHLFNDLETAEFKDFVRSLRDRGSTFGPLRLGYWKHRRDGSLWHGMAFLPGTAATLQQVSNDEEIQKGQERTHRNPEITAGTSEVHRTFDQIDRDVALARYRSVLGMACEPFLALYMLATFSALVIMIVGLSKGYLQHGIPLHLDPIKPSTELSQFHEFDSQTFRTKENFTFIFLPVFLMNCFNFLWFNVDEFYRHMRPFAGMNTPAPASSNILLDYPTSMPIVVSIKAAINCHWRVALFSLLSLTGTIPPIIVSGIFVSTGNARGGIVRLRPVNFWATFSILVIYSICIIFARPSTAYRLPRCVWDIADLALFCYKSRILDDKLLGAPIFSAQHPTDTRIHMESRIHLAKQEYLFGMYLGSDGRRHMGFDVSERQMSSGQVVSVITFDPGKALYLTHYGLRYYFRWPQAHNPT